MEYQDYRRKDVLKALEDFVIRVTTEPTNAAPEEVRALPAVAAIVVGEYARASVY